MKISAIVPAAGSGKRMKDDSVFQMPKQFWPFGNKNILGHVLWVLNKSNLIDEIIVATSEEYLGYCQSEYVDKYGLAKISKIILGGKERADSVFNALNEVDISTTHLMVQDAVRPFLTAGLIENLVKALVDADGIIAARPVVPTLKKVCEGSIISTVDRSSLWEAETPQFFKKDVLEKAYKTFHENKGVFTDEASLVEGIGGVVKVMIPEGINIKITTPEDYGLALKFL